MIIALVSTQMLKISITKISDCCESLFIYNKRQFAFDKQILHILSVIAIGETSDGHVDC